MNQKTSVMQKLDDLGRFTSVQLKRCVYKVRHETKEEAEKTVEAMEKRTKQAFNSYKCRDCLFWHVGHDRYKLLPFDKLV
jgi:predicted oxidoreductase (fatty acid repression mutant protein)